MGLADALAQIETGQPWQTCGVQWAMGQLDDEDGAAFNVAMGSDIRATVLSDLLRDEAGISVSPNAIQRHRRGACKCR